MADKAEERGARAADKLVDNLASRIMSGEWPDGAHLPSERDLIDQYGVSRTVVREAVNTLANRGFVESRPRFRPVVRRPGFDAALAAVESIARHLTADPQGVKALFDMRIFMEAGLVRQAALSARREDIDALHTALQANEAAIAETILFYETDVAFHARLYDVPRNPIFPAIHAAFTDWLSPHWLKMPRSPERNRINYRRHKDIFEAISARDPDAAEAALTAHLNGAWEYVRGTFDDG